MRGLEVAFWGVLGKAPELKTAKTGTRFATMNVVVTVSQADDGKELSQWLRVACFGNGAEAIAARAKKGDRVYCEGQLTMTQWKAADGEVRHGLNVAAWKCERVVNIGKYRERKHQGNVLSPGLPGRESDILPASFCAGPSAAPLQYGAGFDGRDGDPLPF
jgi:single-stranded DNA-binding protein